MDNFKKLVALGDILVGMLADDINKSVNGARTEEGCGSNKCDGNKCDGCCGVHPGEHRSINDRLVSLGKKIDNRVDEVAGLLTTTFDRMADGVAVDGCELEIDSATGCAMLRIEGDFGIYEGVSSAAVEEKVTKACGFNGVSVDITNKAIYVSARLGFK